MSARAGSVSDRLHALERMLAFELAQRLPALEECAEGLQRGAAPAPMVVRSLEGLASSAGELGLHDVGSSARAAADAITAPGLEPRVRAGAFRRALAALRVAAAERAVGAGAEPLAAVQPGEGAARPRRLLVAFEEDAGLSSELAFQLGCFGFLVRAVHDVADFEQALPHAAAIILDVDVNASTGKVPRVLAAVQRARQQAQDAPPLLVISGCDDLATRLRAVRFGADAFLARPLDARELVERVDALVQHVVEARHRVLLVDDDPAHALPVLLALQAGGLDAELALGAMEALRRLDDVEPDVVVVPVALAGCSGAELAAVVRQERRHVDLPVIFLADGCALREQLEAVRRGGQDLVEMPADPAALLLTVRHHAQRHRLLRHFRTRDGLTGLLNFSSAMEALRHACRRAGDEGLPLVLALLDVDGLDRLNRRSGHLTGDAVLRAAADLLRQRFRRSDVVGRYSNRFVVVLPGTSLENAVRVLDETRVLFAEMHRRGGVGGGSPTLSCGVARHQPGETTVELFQAARGALDRAWALGGDRLESGGG